ncbi:hypothetical protein TUMSATVNIG1_16430 [Vibrio nigripulchritudo]|uniref:hypothetical protein n=1 Tax=Vibrio nigripulchritudo TaxID=28173 RepID=UPI00190C2CB1|nr:hypothetical protein [Vibrio nigripulchritudo]BCL69687.1 hypothetical protein VNTUMSATTG_16240 [Vibrio nigripulchritudo]BDU31034.1 hypothetical protein TUMSATVNIG1_16430 [Vibrio nigripulchritudo]
MKFTLIKPNRADIEAQFEHLRPAFGGLSDANVEFEHTTRLVREKRACLYHLEGDGVSLRFVGEAQQDGSYYVSALCGQGLEKGLPVFIDTVKGQGYARLKGQAIRPGIIKIYKKSGFSEVVEDGITHLTLELGGDHGRTF